MPPITADVTASTGDAQIFYDDGTYKLTSDFLAAAVATVRPITAGVFKGYRILTSKNLFGAVLDLSPPPSAFGLKFAAAGGARLIFDGWHIKNGPIFYYQPNIIPWFCHLEFDPAVWSAQGNYVTLQIQTTAGSTQVTRLSGGVPAKNKYLQCWAAGLGSNAANSAAPTITAISGNTITVSKAATATGTFSAYSGDSPANGYYSRARVIFADDPNAKSGLFYGCDIGPGGSLVAPARSTDLTLQGCNLLLAAEPPYDPTGAIHSNCISGDIGGGQITRFSLLDSFCRGRILFADATNGGDVVSKAITGLVIENTWHDHGGVAALQFATHAGPTSAARGIFGHMGAASRPYTLWNTNGRRIDFFRRDSDGAVTSHTSGFNQDPYVTPSRIQVVENNVITVGSQPGGASPADAWRTANPRSSLLDFMGFGSSPPPPGVSWQDSTGVAPSEIGDPDVVSGGLYTNAELLTDLGTYYPQYGRTGRCDVRTSQIQSGGGYPRYDREIGRLVENGCKLLILTMTDAGSFAVAGGTRPDRTKVTNMQAVWNATAQRYKTGAVHYTDVNGVAQVATNVKVLYSFWNKPNSTDHSFFEPSGDFIIGELTWWYDKFQHPTTGIRSAVSGALCAFSPFAPTTTNAAVGSDLFPASNWKNAIAVQDGTTEYWDAATQTANWNAAVGITGPGPRYDLNIETFRSNPNTSDAVILRMLAAGYTDLLIIVNHLGGGTWPNHSLASTYVTAATNIAAHYRSLCGPNVRLNYELINEHNFNMSPKSEPEFAFWCKQLFLGLKAGDSTCFVGTGGRGHAVTNKPPSPTIPQVSNVYGQSYIPANPQQWSSTDGIADHCNTAVVGAGNRLQDVPYDWIGVHPYSNLAGPIDLSSAPAGLDTPNAVVNGMRELSRIDAILTAAGVTAKLWWTEVGQATAPCWALGKVYPVDIILFDNQGTPNGDLWNRPTLKISTSPHTATQANRPSAAGSPWRNCTQADLTRLGYNANEALASIATENEAGSYTTNTIRILMEDRADADGRTVRGRHERLYFFTQRDLPTGPGSNVIGFRYGLYNFDGSAKGQPASSGPRAAVAALINRADLRGNSYTGGAIRKSPLDALNDALFNVGGVLGANPTIVGKIDYLDWHTDESNNGPLSMYGVNRIDATTGQTSTFPSMPTKYPAAYNNTTFRQIKDAWELCILAGVDPTTFRVHSEVACGTTAPYYVQANGSAVNEVWFPSPGHANADRTWTRMQPRIATQPVPAGTAITNNTYFRDYGPAETSYGGVVGANINEEDEEGFYFDKKQRVWFSVDPDQDGVNIGFMTADPGDAVHPPGSLCIYKHRDESAAPGQLHSGLVRKSDGQKKGSASGANGALTKAISNATNVDTRTNGSPPPPVTGDFDGSGLLVME